MASLVCDRLTVKAATRTIINNIDLVVDDGTACVVMGPSGAGKSTLLRAVAGLVPYSGTVSVNQHNLAGIAPHRRGIGLLFQHPRLFPTMNVVDNVAYPLKLQRQSRRQRRTQAHELLTEVAMGDRADAESHELSGGEQQRVALARALCCSPDVMLLDEPLTGLDPAQRRELVELLDQVRRSRKLTWVVVTHNPDDAATIGDTIAVIDSGRIVQHGTVDAVRQQPNTEVVAKVVAASHTAAPHGGCKHCQPAKPQRVHQ